ncbi:MAG TPA: helix-turn-helix transcriptional regulator [Vicinamibacterales bacterium]|nr:helix-turn-helix transcriptional regulator [Vicinamibacterales bacterium]
MLDSWTRFHILCALANGPEYPFQIARDVAEATRGELTLEAGNLHRRLQQLLQEGLVAEAPRPADCEDQRRRYFAVTARGRAALRDEAARMHVAARLARAALDGSSK